MNGDRRTPADPEARRLKKLIVASSEHDPDLRADYARLLALCLAHAALAPVVGTRHRPAPERTP